MIFSSIEQNRTSHEVERQVEMLILEGVLRVGDKLPGERDLALHFNVSRPIVREALSALESKDLLTTKHGGGTFVADVIGTVFAPPVVELIGSNTKAKADYLEYRREMEATAAGMAAARATEADKQLLRTIMQEMEASHQNGDADREAAVDVDFHSTIGECAHNIVLLHTLRSLYRLLEDDVFENRKLVYSSTGVRTQLFQQHKAIYDAILNGDSEAAAKAAHDHINFVADATRNVEREGDRSIISSLRLEQHAGRKQNRTKPQSKRAARTVMT